MAKKKHVAKKKTAVEVPSCKSLAEAAKYQRRIGACLRVMRAKKAKMKALKDDFDAKNALASALSEQVLKFAQAERQKLKKDGKLLSTLLIGTTGRVEWLETQRVVLQNGFTEAQIIGQCEHLGMEDYLRRKVSLDKEAIHADPANLIDIVGVDIEPLELVKVRPSGAHLECMERDPESRKWSVWSPGGSKAGAEPMLQAAE